METLKGKNVLVVGASGGIGTKVTKLLTTSGANVFITGRNADKLAAIAQENSIGYDRMFVMDITNEASVNDTIAAITNACGTIDIVINAAGIGIIKPMDTLTTADFIATLNTNLIGTFHLVKAVLPKMKEVKKGLIINIPGVLGKVPMAGAAAYSAKYS
jgi:NADP-dependent 3-hydroxy acid dehydrogenase YdfG